MRTFRVRPDEWRRLLCAGLALLTSFVLLWWAGRWGASRWETISLASEPAKGQRSAMAPPRAAPVPTDSPAGSPTSQERPKAAPPAGGALKYPAQTVVTPTAPVDLRVDLNRASLSELDSLPGIGPALAGRVVDLREKRGRFESVDELLDVAGIGATRLARLRPFVTVGAAE